MDAQYLSVIPHRQRTANCQHSNEVQFATGDFMATRTTHRSSTGTKLYAKRGKGGQFTDIQTFKRAHGQDIKRTSKAETASAKKKASKKKAAKKK